MAKCHKSGLDHYQILQFNPKTDKPKDPDDAAQAKAATEPVVVPQSNLTRRQRRALQTA